MTDNQEVIETGENLEEKELEDFMDNVFDAPEDEPKAEPEEVEEEPQEEPEEEPEEEPKEEPKPEVKKYTVDGKEYSIDQLVELGLLEDALASREKVGTYQNQVAHFQRLYEESRKAQPQAAAQQQPQVPQITPDQVLAHYTPVAKEMAKHGFIDEHIVEEAPKLTANLMFFRDKILAQEQFIIRMAQMVQNHLFEDNTKNFASRFEGMLDSMAQKGEHYELLADLDRRKDFKEYIWNLNPFVDQINNEFLEKQFAAWNAPALMEAIRQANSEKAQARKEKKRLASGEGTSTRPPKKQAPKPSAFEEDLLELIS